jgi:acyl-CoA thioesterase FadM
MFSRSICCSSSLEASRTYGIKQALCTQVVMSSFDGEVSLGVWQKSSRCPIRLRSYERSAIYSGLNPNNMLRYFEVARVDCFWPGASSAYTGKAESAALLGDNVQHLMGMFVDGCYMVVRSEFVRVLHHTGMGDSEWGVVKTRPVKVGTSSLTLQQLLFVNDVLVAEGGNTIVRVGVNGRPVQLPGHIRARLTHIMGLEASLGPVHFNPVSLPRTLMQQMRYFGSPFGLPSSVGCACACVPYASREFLVTAGQTDLLGHVNHSCYSDMFCDTLYAALQEDQRRAQAREGVDMSSIDAKKGLVKQRMHEIYVEFVQEAHCGDTVDIRLYPMPTSASSPLPESETHMLLICEMWRVSAARPPTLLSGGLLRVAVKRRSQL